ncbi:hypothetical protein AMK59_1901, partial [Oryctes borbonicus]
DFLTSSSKMLNVFTYLFGVLVTSVVDLNVEAVSQDFFWRDYIQGDIPCDAIEGAPGRYIGQAFYKGNLVGTIYPYSDAAVIEMSGKVDIRTNVKIFCSNQPKNLYWEKVNFDNPHDGQMTNVVKGGYQQDGFDLFIGKARYESEWRIGKVVGITYPMRGLWVWNANGNSA